MMRVKRERGAPAPKPGYTETERQRNECSRDESQSTQARRILRSHYRQLRTSIADGKEGLCKGDTQQFDLLFGRVEDLHNLVERPREQIADAEAFLDMASTLLDVAKAAQRRSGVTAADFVQAIMHHFGQGSVADEYNECHVNWKALEREACGVLSEAPGVCTMLGPIEIEPKQRKLRNPRREKPILSVTRPEELKESSVAKTETDANMETMFNVLKTSRKVEFNCLVLNRRSFAQTVENVFCLSFLLKDGNAQVVFADDGTSFLVPRNPPTAADRTSGKAVNTQFVLRIDFNDWKNMKEKVEAGMEAMPHRTGVPDNETLVGSPEAMDSNPSTSRGSRTPIRKTSRNRARETPLASQSDEDVDEHENGGRRKTRSLVSRFARD